MRPKVFNQNIPDLLPKKMTQDLPIANIQDI